jgi:hypothetical protein
MKKTLLWLDDMRNPYISGWLMEYAPEFDEDRDNVVWIKDYNTFIAYIEKVGLPYMIAFDHDLGKEITQPNGKLSLNFSSKYKTGLDCAKWLIDYCIDNLLPLPKYVCQSANPVGVENIMSLLTNFERLREDI